MNPSHPLTPPEERLARVLNGLAGGLVLLALVTFAAAYLSVPGSALYNAPPFWVSNSLAGLLLVAFFSLLCVCVCVHVVCVCVCLRLTDHQ